MLLPVESIILNLYENGEHLAT